MKMNKSKDPVEDEEARGLIFRQLDEMAQNAHKLRFVRTPECLSFKQLEGLAQRLCSREEQEAMAKHVVHCAHCAWWFKTFLRSADLANEPIPEWVLPKATEEEEKAALLSLFQQLPNQKEPQPEALAIHAEAGHQPMQTSPYDSKQKYACWRKGGHFVHQALILPRQAMRAWGENLKFTRKYWVGASALVTAVTLLFAWFWFSNRSSPISEANKLKLIAFQGKPSSSEGKILFEGAFPNSLSPWAPWGSLNEPLVIKDGAYTWTCIPGNQPELQGQKGGKDYPIPPSLQSIAIQRLKEPGNWVSVTNSTAPPHKNFMGTIDTLKEQLQETKTNLTKLLPSYSQLIFMGNRWQKIVPPEAWPTLDQWYELQSKVVDLEGSVLWGSPQNCNVKTTVPQFITLPQIRVEPNPSLISQTSKTDEHGSTHAQERFVVALKSGPYFLKLSTKDGKLVWEKEIQSKGSICKIEDLGKITFKIKYDGDGLQKGQTYRWHLSDSNNVNFRSFDFWFRVLQEEEISKLQHFRERQSDSHFLMWLTYESFGLFPEALQEKDALRELNPGNPFLQGEEHEEEK